MKQQLVVLMGPPGSGKGTISQMAVARLPFEHVSIGNILKWQASQGGALGEQIDFCVRSGKLVDDAIVIKVVRSWLQERETEKNLLLDGFPRTRVQAEALHKLLQGEYPDLQLCLVLFDVCDTEIKRRMAARRVCSNSACSSIYSLASDALKPKEDGICDHCGSALLLRGDDKPEVVQERLYVHHQEADSLVSYYQEAGLAVKIVHADGDIEAVYDDFVSALRLCVSGNTFC